MSKLVNKADFMATLTEEQEEAGYFKFNIPNESNTHSKNGEGVWGWATPEEKEKYNDDNYYGKMTAILCNVPINYYDKLECFTEVVLQCHGDSRPTLDPKWVKEFLL